MPQGQVFVSAVGAVQKTVPLFFWGVQSTRDGAV